MIFQTKTGIMLCQSIDNLDSLNLKDYYGEIKFDGSRCFFKDNRLYHRDRKRNKLRDISLHFPEVKFNIPFEVVLDGELTYFKGKQSKLGIITGRANMFNKFRLELLSKKYPATFMAFDILNFKGNDLTDKPLTERKKILNKLKQYENKSFKIVDYTEHIIELEQRARKENQEGIVLKKKDSRYVAERSFNWLKHKFLKTKIIKFYDFEDNSDGSLTLTNGLHRVKCNDIRAKSVLKEKGFVSGLVEYLEVTETNHLRMPVMLRLIE
jgi:ATP-dependent DNA ligase